MPEVPKTERDVALESPPEGTPVGHSSSAPGTSSFAAFSTDHLAPDPTATFSQKDHTRTHVPGVWEQDMTLAGMSLTGIHLEETKVHHPPSTVDATRDLLRQMGQELDASDGSDRNPFATPPGEQAEPAYQPKKLVGKGGCGEVWEAVQTSLGRVVAIKRIREDIYQRAGSPEDTEPRRLEMEFRQEAFTTASLEHPNIVPVHDLGTDKYGRPILAMKMVRGKPWNKIIQEDENLSVQDFLAKHILILIDVTQAVAFAHSRGIIHRDLKPAQVMVGEFGEVLLMDWGLAVIVDPSRAQESIPQVFYSEFLPTLATASNPSGTPAFMAPEQTEETAANLGSWTDIYLLGGILYYLLTRTVPHVAPDSRSTFYRAMEGIVDPPRKRAASREIPEELEDLCLKAMAKNPEDRFPSARMFLLGLQDYLSGSGKRRESMTLTEDVSLRIGASHGCYKSLAECDNMIIRALGLWPDNPEAPGLRERVLITYARTAIESGDLKLAAVQVERLEDCPEKDRLREEVGECIRKTTFQARQRRFAMGAVVALFGVAFIAWMALRETTARAETKERLASLIGRVNTLRRSENDLAEQIARLVPMPRHLLDDVTQLTNTTFTQDTRLKTLLKERRLLHIERADLAAEAPGRLEREPMELAVGEGNLRLARARSAQDYMRAYDAYKYANRMAPDNPVPLRGMGIALARAGSLTSATLALAESSARTLEIRGEQHPEYGLALALEGEARSLSDGGGEAQASFYRRSVAILEPQWADSSLQLAERYLVLGEFARSLATTQAVVDLSAGGTREDQLRLAHACHLAASAQDGLGHKDEARRLWQRGLDIYTRELGPDHSLARLLAGKLGLPATPGPPGEESP